MNAGGAADLLPAEAVQAAVTYSRNTSYFDRASNTLIVHNPKCASTSLFLRVMAANGIDPDLVMEQARYPGIEWDEGIWMVVPDLPGVWRNLDAFEQDAVQDPTQVRMVALVREPRDRLWSAWVSKILSGGVYYDFFYGPDTALEQTGLASLRSIDDAVAAFAEFVRALSDGHPILLDPHFIPQATLLSWTHPECEFLPISRAGDVIGRIASDTPARRANISTASLPRPMLPRSIDDQIAALYASDHDAYGTVWSDPGAASNRTPPADGELFDAAGVTSRLRLGRRLANFVRDGEAAVRMRQNSDRQIDEAKRELADIEAALAEARRAHHEARLSAAVRETQLLETQAKLQLMLSSKSWRWTRLLRGSDPHPPA